ncbi:MAG TPA: S8 family serine peptidase [Solirubrobacteraceae bacterium]
MRRVVAVTAIGLVVLVAAPARAADPLRSTQWYLDAVRAGEAHRVATGTGVTVAVLDTGVDARHPDLRGQVVVGPDFVGTLGAGEDPNGHGTNVAGVIAANAGNGLGVEGAAPRSKVLSIRVMGADGSGDTGRAARGIDAAIAAGARVINLSLTPHPTLLHLIDARDPIIGAIERANAAGAVVVVAAGNYGMPLCAQPPSLQGVICVEALNRARRRSHYSDYGVRVDLSAPGGDDDAPIHSTAPGGGYSGMVGTSQATPLVSAAAALLLSLGLERQQVIHRILESATDLGYPGQDLEYGHGALNMEAAVAGLGPAPQQVSVSVSPPSHARAALILRRGLRLWFTGALPGTYAARLTIGGRVLARGRRALAAPGTAQIVLRASAAGRRTLRRERGGRVRLTVVAPDDTKVSAVIGLR